MVGEPKEKVLTAFAITSCTGPALGVVFGGWLVDRMGGYKDESGEAVCTALKVCAWFCIGAFAAAVRNFDGLTGNAAGRRLKICDLVTRCRRDIFGAACDWATASVAVWLICDCA